MIDKKKKRVLISKAGDVFQYILIYLMILEQDACLYYLHTVTIRNIVIAVCFFLILVQKIKLDRHLFKLLSIICIVGFFTLITSIMNNGGIGAYLVLSISEQLLIAYCAYAYSKQKFVYRYVKMVVFLAVISLVMYSIGLVNPNFLLSMLPSYDIGWTYKFNGIFFYTARMREMGRNTGIFREPGLYTIVLNSAIFMCVYLKKFIPHKVGALIAILVVCLITTGSATGYIGLIGIITTFLLNKTNKAERRWKRNICYLVFGILVVLLIDYYIRETSSFLQAYFIEKISTMSDLSATTTGSVRAGTILLCLVNILKYPFGIGAKNAMPYLSVFGSVNGYAVTGARILITTLGIGIIPVVIILTYIFHQGYVNYRNYLILTLLIFLYFNTALAQSREFYPALVVLYFINTNLRMTSKNTCMLKKVN